MEIKFNLQQDMLHRQVCQSSWGSWHTNTNCARPNYTQYNTR